MSFYDANGNLLSKSALLALASSQSQETVYLFNADVHQKFTPDGAPFESGSKLIFHAGQTVKQSDIDALFATATVTSVSPAAGGVAGGTAVVITGTNLAGVSGVAFGATAATNVKVVSATRVTCTAPAHTAATVNVVVHDDAGDVTVTNGFVYS
jgi:xanthine/CO dehydrogenase XdhC/CoxF family maturation factor